jgi:hypothetical protein
LSGCSDRDRKIGAGKSYDYVNPFVDPRSARRDLDILFVIDNSQSMLNGNISYYTALMVFVLALENMPGGFPNIHIGVITTDLGTGSYDTGRFCEEVGGDRGVLGKVGLYDNLGEICIGPRQRYLVDIEPSNCRIEKDEQGTCQSHSCTQADCDRAERADEVLTLSVDDRGCPRCRNYSGSMTDTLSCLAAVGVSGCGFEQPFEAMYLALDADTTSENKGFLRDSAHLAVLVVADEDDCSASKPDVIFDPDEAEDGIDSALGFWHSFRCFEFGIQCDMGGRGLGPRNDCVQREDDRSMLHAVSRYTGFLEALRDPRKLTVATIGGPFDGSVEVQFDSQNRPELKPTCTDSTGMGATPGIRLKAFTRHFNSPADMEIWAYTSVCMNDFSMALHGFAEAIIGAMNPYCTPQPFAGCRNGPGGTDCSPCLPLCEVYDYLNRGTQNQARLRVPWCGEICLSGMCTEADLDSCEYDENGKCICDGGYSPILFDRQVRCAPLPYPDGVPPSERIPELADLVPRLAPTCHGMECPEETDGRASACWYLSDESDCQFGAGARIARPSDPPPGTRTQGLCAFISDSEVFCTDGVDDDEDCLTDCEDPDCADNPACTSGEPSSDGGVT